jgi:tetratricopeptide (TPR) repeat protein
LGRRKDYPLAVAAGYEFLAENAVVMGMWEAVFEYAGEDKKIGRQTGALDRIVWAEFSLANAQYGTGKLAEAEETARMSIETAEQIGEGRLVGWLTSLLSLIVADRGELEQSRDLAERGLQINQELGQVILESWSVNALGNLASNKAECARVLDLCESLTNRIQKTDNKTSKVYLLPVQSWMLLNLGQLDKAQEKLEELFKVLSSTGVKNYPAVANRLKGEIYHQSGDLVSAQSSYQQAADQFDALGSRIDLARTLLLLGKLYIDRGKNDLARSELEKARHILVDCGAGRYIKDIELLLKRI